MILGLGNEKIKTFFSAMKSGNQELALAISKWVLKEAGVLRIQSVKHHIVGQKAPPTEYTIMDDVVSLI